MKNARQLMTICNKAGAGNIASAALRILRREIENRSGTATALSDDESSAGIILRVSSSGPAEGFVIEGERARVEVKGNDERGLLYGVGKLLRTNLFESPADLRKLRFRPWTREWGRNRRSGHLAAKAGQRRSAALSVQSHSILSHGAGLRQDARRLP